MATRPEARGGEGHSLSPTPHLQLLLPASWPTNPGWVAEMPLVHKHCGLPGQRGQGEACVGLSCVLTAGYSSMPGLSVHRARAPCQLALSMLRFSPTRPCALQPGHSTCPERLVGWRWTRELPRALREKEELPGDGWCGRGVPAPRTEP